MTGADTRQPSLEALKAAFDELRRTPVRVEIPRRTRAALLALPVLTPAVARVLALEGLDRAVEAGVLSLENGVFRVRQAQDAWEREGGWGDEVVALGEALAHQPRGEDDDETGWTVLRRWAELARRVGDPADFARVLLEKAQDVDGVRWLEAGRRLERLLGGRLRLGVLRAARARVLAERRAEDEASLRYFVAPADTEEAFNALWRAGRSPEDLAADVSTSDALLEAPRGLHLLGDGGTGKTTFIRHLTARLVPARGGVVARLDFDHLDPDYPERDPGLLVAHLAEELLLQADSVAAESELAAVGRLADGVRERLSGAEAQPDETEVDGIIDAFAEAVRAFGRTVVLIFDTCEELARRRADGRVSRAVEETLRRTERLLGQCKNLRVVFSGRWPLPPRTWLVVTPLDGFDEGDALRYLDRRASGRTPPPAWQGNPSIRNRILDLSRVGEGAAARYSPFELNWLAGWVEAEPTLKVEDLSHAPVDRYLEMRVLGRVHGPDVRPLLPAAALLGRFDADLLRACVDLPSERFEVAYEELCRQEWVKREGGRHQISARLRDRLAAHFGGVAREKVRAALARRLLQRPASQAPTPPSGDDLDPAFAVAWLRLDFPAIPKGWDTLVARCEADGRWGFLAKVAELAPPEGLPPLVLADGLAAERWLGRPVAPGAWAALRGDPRLTLLSLAGEAALKPQEATARRAFADGVQGASESLLRDARVHAACVGAVHAIAEAHEGVGLLDRAMLAAAERLARGSLAPFVQATLGRLCWQAGDREEARTHWASVPASPDPGQPRLYLPGIEHLEARTRLEVRRGLWPACLPATRAFRMPPPPEEGGADLDRLKSLKIRAFGVGRLPRGLFPDVADGPRLPDPPRAAAHRAVDPWVVTFLEESALAAPERIPAALAALARLRDLALRRTNALELVRSFNQAGARLLLAARQADAWGFGEMFSTSGRPPDVDICLSLLLWCGSSFNVVRIPTGPEAAHAVWRNDRDGHGALAAVEPHWTTSPDLQLDAWEASRLELTADDITLFVPDDPWQPELTLRRSTRARALGASPPSPTTAIERLGPRLAGRVVLDEAEHLALRLPALALEAFEDAAELFAKENDAFGVLRARLGQALAGMAVADVDAVCEAKQAVRLTAETPAGWRQRGELMLAWLEEGGRVGPKTRAVLADWQGPRDPLLSRIETARAPLDSDAPRPDARSLGPGPVPAEPAPALDDLLRAALDAGLAAPDRRPLLLEKVPPDVVGALPRYGRPADQLRADLSALSRNPTALRTWLQNALRMVRPRPEARIFERALEALVFGPGPVAVGVTRLHLEVPPTDRMIFAALDRPIEVRWRLEGRDPTEGSERINRPLGHDFWPSVPLTEAVQRLRQSGPGSRLVPAPGAEAWPWEALLGRTGWLPIVRSGGAPGRQLVGRDRWVVGEDRDDLYGAQRAWRGEVQPASGRELLANPKRPSVLHLLCWPTEMAGEVRISFERSTEETVQQSRSAGDFARASEVVGPAPPPLCLLQVPGLRETETTRWTRYQAALLRVFANDLGRLGVTWIVVLPAVDPRVAEEVIGRLTQVPENLAGADLLQAVASADRAHRGVLRDACVLGPD